MQTPSLWVVNYLVCMCLSVCLCVVYLFQSKFMVLWWAENHATKTKEQKTKKWKKTTTHSNCIVSGCEQEASIVKIIPNSRVVPWKIHKMYTIISQDEKISKIYVVKNASKFMALEVMQKQNFIFRSSLWYTFVDAQLSISILLFRFLCAPLVSVSMFYSTYTIVFVRCLLVSQHHR